MQKAKKKHATGALYVLKKITYIGIKLGFRKQFIRFFSLSAWLYLKLRNNLTIVGRKNIPKNTTMIIAGTHSSAADALIYAAVFCGVFGEYSKYIANSRDFEKDNFQRYFHHLFQGKRRQGTGQELVDWMANELIRGNNIGIPPEGMYNKNGKIMKGYTGITRVYYSANPNTTHKIPILPVVTIGANKAYPTNFGADGKYHAKKTGIICRIGKPFHLEEHQNLDKTTIRQETDNIMEKLANLALQKEGAVDSWILKEKQRNKPRSY